MTLRHLFLFGLVLLVGVPAGAQQRGADPASLLPGYVFADQKISDTEGGFTGALDNNDRFGGSVASVGDLDGDGVADLAVGASSDDDGGSARGAVWVLFLNADGTVRAHQKISSTEGGFTGALDDFDQFGQSVASMGDLDGDGVADLAVGVNRDDDGGVERGAVWVLFLDADGTVRAHQKISSTEGGFTGTLDDYDRFGRSIASVGDLDGDGVADLAVGATGDDGDGGYDRGAVWVLFLNADGTVKAHQKISSTEGGFTGALDPNDYFGTSVASTGDGDGVRDLAVGATGDDDGGSSRGAVWVLFLDADGTVRAHQKISSTEGGFTGALDDTDFFGVSAASVGDLDGDGVGDLAVGATLDDDGRLDRGAVWVLFLNADGTVKAYQKISDTEGGFTGALDARDYFGGSVASVGDLDGDGVADLAVGAPGDDDGGEYRGAVWVLFLEGVASVPPPAPLSITLTPTGIPAPVVVAPGERVEYAIRLAVGLSGPSPVQFWTRARFPDGTLTTPILDPRTVAVPPGTSAVFRQRARIPGSTAPGTYEYIAYAGASFPTAEVEDSLSVEVTASSPLTEAMQGADEWTVEVSPEAASGDGVSDGPTLLRPFPNPAHGPVTVSFALAEAGDVRVVVYDALGREVAVLADGFYQPGPYEAQLDGRALPTGTYLVRMEAGGAVQTQRVTLVR